MNGRARAFYEPVAVVGIPLSFFGFLTRARPPVVVGPSRVEPVRVKRAARPEGSLNSHTRVRTCICDLGGHRIVYGVGSCAVSNRRIRKA